MQKADLTYHDMQDLWRMVREASTTHADEYRAQWVPYLSQFEHHWRRALTTCNGIDDLERAIQLAPFAQFGLRLSELHPTYTQLAAILEHAAMQHVCELDLYGVSIDDEEAQLLAQCQSLNQLVWLELTGCWLDAPCCEALCQGGHFGSLRVLRVADGDIQNEGVAHLAHARNMPSLTALSIANNEIDDDGLATLIESPLFSRLVALDLGHNPITDRSIKRLLDALPSSQLNALGLSETEINHDALPDELQSILVADYDMSMWMFPFGKHY